ncbi:putative lactoylglutathione lyase [Phaeomoniella chlamydospora]|uniref:Lactoylglutathione lyase n=1 Tax=Phaeomoniella chlamydospora TaxID=158046 RepID=A0A0G2EYU1_PHACM|nr:putative lactoylglutathione lyase [Phaeomoniella chlamydospora]
MAPPDYSKWKMNHTMIRVKDPKRTIAFYNQLGLNVVAKLPQPTANFDLYFLGYDYHTSESAGKERSDREGLLELTHNYGTETDDNYKVSTGNDGPLGFGHIGIAVDNIQAAAKRLDGLGVQWHEKLEQGLPHRAFCLDPDGYQVELVSRDHKATVNETTTDVETYRFNHTAIRVKDPKVSLKWYEETLGMSLLRTVERDDLTLYFVGYPGAKGNPTQGPAGDTSNYLSDREGLVELIWIHGSENKEGKVYHNGNNEPQGFGHLCKLPSQQALMGTPGANTNPIGVAVDDLQAACDHFEETKVNWKKRLTDGRMKTIAFIMDPDDYWVEIIQNSTIKQPLGVQ